MAVDVHRGVDDACREHAGAVGGGRCDAHAKGERIDRRVGHSVAAQHADLRLQLVAPQAEQARTRNRGDLIGKRRGCRWRLALDAERGFALVPRCRGKGIDSDEREYPERHTGEQPPAPRNTAGELAQRHVRPCRARITGCRRIPAIRRLVQHMGHRRPTAVERVTETVLLMRSMPPVLSGARVYA